jgi:carboxyl-terminal processing protease
MNKKDFLGRACNNKRFPLKQLLLICLLIFNMSACTEAQQRFNIPSRRNDVPPDEARMDFVKLNRALLNIMNEYVDTINTKKVVEDAIIGMLEKLDPHSNYMTPEEVKEMNEPLQGNFDGIGIQFNMLTDTLNVVQVIPGGPSEKVGIKVGDRMIMVNDSLIAGIKMKNTDVMSRLRGPKGTEVNVKILRNRNPQLLDFKIVRDKIPIYSVDATYMIDKENGYVKLNRFSATTYEEFENAINKLQQQGVKNLILDLQGNGGGYLGAATQIANEFLKKGSLIVYTEGTHQPRVNENATNQGKFEFGRLIILTDESSASASEIVSGAVQDWDRGLIVGRRTFGKGLVQRPVPLPDGSMIRLTTARYYTPTGRSIQKPYENGDSENYNKDLINRYNRGELISADSIHFHNSQKYNTLINKRTVYGGGGIMPDYFVPLDTTYNTRLLRELNAYGITYKFTSKILDNDRNSYKERYPTFAAFDKNFIISDKILADLMAFYKEDRNKAKKEMEELAKSNTENVDLLDIEENKDSKLSEDKITEDLKRSSSVIKAQIKSIIARDIFGESGYYQVINRELSTYNKAIEIIRNENEYNKLLSGKN